MCVRSNVLLHNKQQGKIPVCMYLVVVREIAHKRSTQSKHASQKVIGNQSSHCKRKRDANECQTHEVQFILRNWTSTSRNTINQTVYGYKNTHDTQHTWHTRHSGQARAHMITPSLPPSFPPSFPPSLPPSSRRYSQRRPKIFTILSLFTILFDFVKSYIHTVIMC